MKIHLNSAGFSALEVALVVIVMGIIGGSGYYVYNAQKETKEVLSSSNESSTQQSPANSTELAKVYTDKSAGFTVNYPESWKVQSKTTDENTDMAMVEASITSPTGTKLTLNSDNGGRGGMCDPKASDRPFASGNDCASFEYLSAEDADIKNINYAKSTNTGDGNVKTIYEPASVKLVTTHYSDPDGIAKYGVGLEVSNPEYPIKVNNPQMGLYGPESFISGYQSNGKDLKNIYAYALGNNEAFLQSKDATTIKAILRSFKLK